MYVLFSPIDTEDLFKSYALIHLNVD